MKKEIKEIEKEIHQYVIDNTEDDFKVHPDEYIVLLEVFAKYISDFHNDPTPTGRKV